MGGNFGKFAATGFLVRKSLVFLLVANIDL